MPEFIETNTKTNQTEQGSVELINLKDAIQLGLQNDDELKPKEIKTQAEDYLKSKNLNLNDSNFFINKLMQEIKDGNDNISEIVQQSLLELKSSVERGSMTITSEGIEQQSKIIEKYSDEVKIASNYIPPISKLENMDLGDVVTAIVAAGASISAIGALMVAIKSRGKEGVPELVGLGALTFLGAKGVINNTKLDHIVKNDDIIESLKNQNIDPDILSQFTESENSGDNQLKYLSLFGKDAQKTHLLNFSEREVGQISDLSVRQKNHNLGIANTIDYSKFDKNMKNLNQGESWEQLPVDKKLENLELVITGCQKENLGKIAINQLKKSLINDNNETNKGLDAQLDTFHYMLNYFNDLGINSNNKYKSLMDIGTIVNKKSKIGKNLFKSVLS